LASGVMSLAGPQPAWRAPRGRWAGRRRAG